MRPHPCAPTKALPAVLLLAGLPWLPTLAQDETPLHQAYWTSSGEWILSWPRLEVNGDDRGAVARFAPFFNVQGIVNYDPSRAFGLFSGLGVRNLGFIRHAQDGDRARYKYRAYTLGVPVGFKAGRMNGGLFFAGYELELPFNYKEKRFLNEKKEDKFVVWFSDRTEPLLHSVMMGIQSAGGVTLKVKYYLNSLHDQGYTETKDGVTTKPYEGLSANILYLSIAYGLFKRAKNEFPGFERPPPRDVHTRR